jgi:hypothetical protein
MKPTETGNYRESDCCSNCKFCGLARDWTYHCYRLSPLLKTEDEKAQWQKDNRVTGHNICDFFSRG